MALVALAVAIIAIGISGLAYRLARSDSDVRRRANLAVGQLSTVWSEGFGDHSFVLAAGGPSVARNIRYWVVDSTGERMSTTVGDELLVLGPSQTVRSVAIRAEYPDEPQDWQLMVEWEDDTGEHCERRLSIPSRPQG